MVKTLIKSIKAAGTELNGSTDSSCCHRGTKSKQEGMVSTENDKIMRTIIKYTGRQKIKENREK